MNTPKILNVPSAYKAGKIYSPIPTDGAGDLTFTRASGGTRINSNGIIEDMGTDVPRLDYNGGGCPSWLLEPARTNLLIYSEDFTNISSWLKDDVAVDSNVAISPDGTMNADRVINSNSGAFRLRQSVSVDSSKEYTFSFWLKKDTDSAIRISNQNFDSTEYVDFNFDTEQIIGGTFTKGENGWYRITSNFTTVTDLAGAIAFFGTTPNASTFIWGAQLEEGGYPTSYIKTEAATVTRNEEDISKTFSPAIPLLSGGTVYINLKGQKNGNGGGRPIPFLRFQLDGSNYIGFANSDAVWRARIETTTHGALLNNSPIPIEDDVQMAVSASSSGWSMYANGVQFASGNEDCSDITDILNLVTTIQEDRGIISIKALALWDTALTDAELQQITT